MQIVGQMKTDANGITWKSDESTLKVYPNW